MMNCGRRWRAGRVVGLVITLGVILVGCAATRSEIQTEFREARIAQQNYEAGKVKYRAGDYAGAVPLLQRTLSLDPQYDDAEMYLGWSHYHLGRYPDASRHFRQVVARQPRWVGAWNGLGWSQYRARQYQPALEAFQAAVSLDPTYRDVGVGLAYALFELGRYRDALPHLHRLTRDGAYLYFPDLDSDVEEVRSYYAWCLYYTGGVSAGPRGVCQGAPGPSQTGGPPQWPGLDVPEAGGPRQGAGEFPAGAPARPELRRRPCRSDRGQPLSRGN